MFLEKGAAQCGFCTPGMLLTLLSAIERGAAEREEFQEAISGNLCRCTGYKAILDSAEAFVLERTSKDALGTDR
jgi:carbon-monoxide dehydrogenase small subunit